MDLRTYLSILDRKKQTIVSVVLIFLVLGGLLTFTQPLKYEAKSNLLVVQNYSEGIDPYNAAKANEYLSTILAKIITSNVFFEEAKNIGYEFDLAYFGNTVLKQSREWQKTVYANPVSDTGIIAVNVYHPDVAQLDQIARAVNYTLITRHQNYHGGGENIVIKPINTPVYSSYPVKPNVIFNFAAAFVLGAIASLFFIYLFPEDEYSIRLWPRLARRRKEADYDYGYPAATAYQPNAYPQPGVAPAGSYQAAEPGREDYGERLQKLGLRVNTPDSARMAPEQNESIYRPEALRNMRWQTPETRPAQAPERRFNDRGYGRENRPYRQVEYQETPRMSAYAENDADDDLDYEDIVKQGRIENVLNS